MKLLMMGNAPWVKSGYGKNIMNISLRLKDKYELGILCSYGLLGGEIDWNGMKCYPAVPPKALSGEGSFLLPTLKTLDKIMKKGKYDASIFHFDIWVANSMICKGELKSRYISYCPVDGDPISPLIIDGFSRADEVVVFCDWAEKILKEIDVKSTVVPHGVDTKIYNPATKDKSEYKRKLGIPEDCTIFTIVGTNVGPRKGIQEAMESYGRFLKKNPEAKNNTRLYIHSDTAGSFFGYDLINLANLFEISENVIFTAGEDLQNVPEEAMADLFRASDVHVLTSHSEGFGMPLIESAACGIPSIATDFSSMTELVKGHGILVRVANKEIQTSNYTYHALPYVPDIVKAFETYWNDPNKIKEDGKKAAEFALGYDWDKVIIPKWVKFLDVYEQSLPKK